MNSKNKWALKVDSFSYHDLLDCDLNLQTNSLRYLWQIALDIGGCHRPDESGFKAMCRNPANPDLSGLVHRVQLILKSTIKSVALNP